MTERNSALYTKLHVNKYLAKNEDSARVQELKIQHTVLSGEVAGDVINLCVIPAGYSVVGLLLTHPAMVTTAAVLGDAGDDDRYRTTMNLSAAGSLAGVVDAGMLYKPTADTIVQLKFVTGNPTVGSVVKGALLVVPGTGN